jgi:propanol-preferring alcohol dehydrogenase
VLKLVKHTYPNSRVYVFARDLDARRFTLELGAEWAGDTTEHSPLPLDAIIDTTPAWKPVVEALGNLRPGGRLVINAIRKEDSDKNYLLNLNYGKHLWMEKEIKTVANITHQDIREFMSLATTLDITPTITTYKLEEASKAC